MTYARDNDTSVIRGRSTKKGRGWNSHGADKQSAAWWLPVIFGVSRTNRVCKRYPDKKQIAWDIAVASEIAFYTYSKSSCPAEKSFNGYGCSNSEEQGVIELWAEVSKKLLSIAEKQKKKWACQTLRPALTRYISTSDRQWNMRTAVGSQTTIWESPTTYVLQPRIAFLTKTTTLWIGSRARNVLLPTRLRGKKQ